MIYLLRKIILPVVFIIALVMVMSVFVPPPKAATITSAADQRGTLVFIRMDNSEGRASISLITSGTPETFWKISDQISDLARNLAARHNAEETHYALYYPSTSEIKTMIDLKKIIANSSEAELVRTIIDKLAALLGKKLTITGVETKKENKKTLPPPRPPQKDQNIKHAGISKTGNRTVYSDGPVFLSFYFSVNRRSLA